MSPEKLHLLTVHIPFIGAVIALLPITWGYLQKNRQLLIVGLLILSITSWMTPIVMASGENAYERYKSGPVAAYLDAESYPYLEEHEERAEFWAKLLYLNAILSTIALALTLAGKKSARPITLAVSISCLIAIAAAIWIAESGGKIRRPDFRTTQSEQLP